MDPFKGLNCLLSPTASESLQCLQSFNNNSFRAITRSMLTMEEEFPGHLLHQSALWGNDELLRDLLSGEQSLHVNAIDGKGRTALHAAVSCDSIPCTKVLLQNGADPNIGQLTAQIDSDINIPRKNPLHIAAENGNATIVELLIDHNADVLAKDGNGFTAMDIAEQSGHSNVMRILKTAADELESARHVLFDTLSVACSRGSTSEAKSILQQLDENDTEIIVNTAPNGCNTLLFKASQDGHKDIVELLLQYGADGRIHPVTKYSPLYIAAYHGRKEIVEILLNKFPHLVHVSTVEKWLPIHAAAINNHLHIIELLLKFQYHDDLLITFHDKNKQMEYRMPFDINAQDVTGQTVLYVAALVGNQRLVDFLVQFRVESTPLVIQTDCDNNDIAEDNNTKISSLTKVISPSKTDSNTIVVSPHSSSHPKKKSPSIQKIIDKLSPDSNSKNHRHIDDDLISSSSTITKCTTICPINIDIYCNNDSETALHAAIRKKHYSIASTLLHHGANPNLLIRMSDDTPSADTDDQTLSFSTSLKEACRNRDASIVDLLVRHGARDDDCLALRMASINGDNHLMSKILALKAHPDPEFKINRKALQFNASGSGAGIGFVGSVTFSSMFPTTPVMVNWHKLKGLNQVRKQWLIDAAVAHNIKLKLNVQNQLTAITAITRLDLSGNGLKTIPLCVFQMHSLKILNISQNKLNTLPETETDLMSPQTVSGSSSYTSALKMKKSRSYSSALTSTSNSSSSSNTGSCIGWILPCLEELYLQDNQLECIPSCVFELPSMLILDLSNNKLHSLPYKLWLSPKLRELNLSLNLLRDLPSRPSNYPSMTMSPQRLLNAKEKEKINASKTIIKKHQLNDGDVSKNRNTDDNEILTHSITEENDDNDNEIDDISSSERYLNKNLRNHDLRHVNLWNDRVEIIMASAASTLPLDDESSDSSSNRVHCSKLVSLNLSHNGFTRIPPAMSCLAVNLQRLNMSYNCLTSLGCVKSYPSTLKHMDMSQNQIIDWFRQNFNDDDKSLSSSSSHQYDATACFCDSSSSSSSPKSSLSGKHIAGRVTICCCHKQHTRMDSLRTLILANNKLSSICLTAEDADISVQSLSINDEFEPIDAELMGKSTTSGGGKHQSSRLLFPNLSMMDVSNNSISEVPTAISDLTNLSVLNLSGNTLICSLPPEMGLLNKLWNLGTRGCLLNEPLKTMVESKKYKTMDIIGCLKSILENAKPYARMKLMIVGVQGIGKTSLLEQLRSEGTGTYRRKAPEHWGKRMGNKNLNMKTPKGVTLSTVGVDVNDWTYEKRVRGQSQFGSVSFRTWDFGGQKEYYATHQYFLSKRSLYLVVWKITDGEKGIDGILQWLVNIQARAPNAPVLIVGTHYDLIREYFPPCYSEDLQQQIRDRFINVVDADKCGLPRVIDTIEVSVKTKHNVKLLCNLIYDTVFDLRCPGTKERLLEQKIPATYLALEDVIAYLSHERRCAGKDPVLRSEEYKSLVMREMMTRFGMSFRDASELHQATAFLHENGVLLHYEDATLKDLYFLDPQWLCDMLAHVVTIREINPYARNGLMKTDDLKQLFRLSSCAPSDAQTYILNLLNKFEVALTWDSRTLLIPSLLPTEENLRSGVAGCDVRVKIPVRSRSWALRKTFPYSSKASPPSSPMTFNTPDVKRPQTLSINDIKLNITPEDRTHDSCKPQVYVSVVNRPSESIHRLLLMTYFPSGFWSRLMARILADDFIIEIIRSYFIVPKDGQSDPLLLSIFSREKAEWLCWQTGMALKHLDTLLMRVKEVIPTIPASPYDYYHMKLLLQQEGHWKDVNVLKSSLLEIYLPNQALYVQTRDGDGVTKNYTIEPDKEFITKLLAIAVDHMDTLLEDWYPTLGTRFVHTSEGKFLVTRLVPCTSCLMSQLSSPNMPMPLSPFSSSTIMVNSMTGAGSSSFKSPEESEWQIVDMPKDNVNHRQIGSHDSATSRDSGMGQESRGSSRVSSVEGYLNSNNYPLNYPNCEDDSSPTVYSFMVEECILNIYEQRSLECPLHGQLSIKVLAPDTGFVDLGDHYLIKPDNIRYGRLLGRGAFGFVFRASSKQRTTNTSIDVAMKMLQPVDPKMGARQSDLVAYKAATNKWERDPMQYACKAYCTARQELNILMTLRHQHIVPLVGLCTKPLALVLRLAPMGSLDTIIKNYRRSGVQFSTSVVQRVALQVAKALEYLHQQRIIYRDLKSENVLVWDMPLPFTVDSVDNGTVPRVDVKLADYGISRSTLPTGTKGFGGTEGFMAPEIMRYNGEEEYTEKVDCFSFGMFFYELMTLRLPFENQECVKEHILEGGRPSLTQRDVSYPSYFIELMTLCWSQQPKDRPTVSQIVSIISAPEFNNLWDVMSLSENYAILSSSAVELNSKCQYVWLSRIGKQTDLLVSDGHCWTEYHTLVAAENITVTSICLINDHIWLGDSKACIHIFHGHTFVEIDIIQLDSEDTTPTAVRCMSHVQMIEHVAISSSSGRLWLCNIDTKKLKEIGNNGVPFLCVTNVTINDDDDSNLSNNCQLWCGQSEGSISVISLSTNAMILSQYFVSHYPTDEHEIQKNTISEKYDVFQLVSGSNSLAGYVWSYLYPGCVVYQWDINKRMMINKIDCSKLAPCSESLMSISIEEHLSPGRCQVTSMAIVEQQMELYIGTTWGCIIIVEAITMRPITVFRPYEEEVKAILPLKEMNYPKSSPSNDNNQQLSSEEQQLTDEKTQTSSPVKRCMIATVGKGYRNLLCRYVHLGNDNSVITQKGLHAIYWSSLNWAQN